MTSMKHTIVLASGGFDPLHRGHVEYLQLAAELGTLIVGVNSDAWLTRKKGRPFMGGDDRLAVIRALRCVWQAALLEGPDLEDADDTACKFIIWACQEYAGHRVVFAKGGDRGSTNTPERQLLGDPRCLNLSFVYGLGEKIQSSSSIVDAARDNPNKGG